MGIKLKEALVLEISNENIILYFAGIVALLLSLWWPIFARWFLKNQEVQWPRRCISLVLAGIIGMALAYMVYHNSKTLQDNSVVLYSSLTILFLGLPIFFTLWLLRTHDVQRQMNKTKENTNNSTLFESVKMLTEKYPEGYTKENSLSAKIALEQLAYLRREPGFDKERIDLIIQGLSLKGIYLAGAYLSGLNLSRANLSDAHLEEADLSGTNLSGTDLRRTHLQGTNLSNSVYDVKDKRKWNFATYNNETKFDGTWLENTDARNEAGMVHEKFNESA